MFYKAARSRAQANGKVRSNHFSIEQLKVRRQSFIIWGDVTGDWQEAGRGQRTFWSCELSIWSHVNRCPSNCIWYPSKYSRCVLKIYLNNFNISTQHFSGSYWESKRNQSQRHYCEWHTLFIVDSAANEETALTCVLARNESHSSNTLSFKIIFRK